MHYKFSLNIILTIMLAMPGTIWGAERGPRVPDQRPKRPIPGAVRLYFTDSGTRYLSNHLFRILNDASPIDMMGGVLQNPDIPVREINLNDFVKNHPAAGDFIKSFQLFAGQYVKCIKNAKPDASIADVHCGKSSKEFAVQNLKLKTTIKQFEYGLKYTHFSLLPVAKAQSPNSATFRFRAELKELTVSADSVKVQDTNNKFLRLGFNFPKFSLDPTGPKLTLDLTFKVGVLPDGVLDVKVLKTSANIKSAKINLDFATPTDPDDLKRFGGKPPRPGIQVPQVKIVFSDEDSQQVAVLDDSPLIAEFEKAKPGLVSGAQEMLDTLFNSMGPKFLTDYLKGNLGPITDEYEIDPPGTCTGEERAYAASQKWLLQLPDLKAGVKTPEQLARCQKMEPFRFGFQFDSLAQMDLLSLGVAGWVEDPKNPASSPFIEESLATGLPNLDGVDPKLFDVAMVIDRGLINRVMQLSYERGYFTNIPFRAKPTDKFSYLSLVTAPVVAMEESNVGKVSDSLHVSAKIMLSTYSFDHWALSMTKPDSKVGLKADPGKPVILSALANGELRRMKNSQDYEFVIHGVDRNSVKLHSGMTLSGNFADIFGSVMSGLKDKIEEAFQETNAVTGVTSPKPILLADGINISREILGQKIQVYKMKTDENGHGIIYCRFGKNGARR